LAKEPNAPRKLFFDIETSLMLFAGWQPGQQYVGTKQIVKEREVICIGYAWDDDPAQVLSFDLNKHDRNLRDDDADLEMLEKFSRIFSLADVVIGHNIKAFDIAVMRARLIKHSLPDFAPVLIDDSLEQIKKIGFSGHSLDYVSQYLGIEQKKDHPYGLWLDITLRQDATALAKMLNYCLGDVEHNRDMYKRLLPYIKPSLNMAVFHSSKKICPNCGAKGSLVSRGHRHTRSGKYHRYYCKQCKTFPTLGKNVITDSGDYPR